MQRPADGSGVETYYLGHIAILLGRKLTWDPVQEHFINAPQADRHLFRALREQWHLGKRRR